MPASAAEVSRALAAVVDPEIERAVLDLGMVRSAVVKRGRVEVALALPSSHHPRRQLLVERVKDALSDLEGVRQVEVSLNLMTEEERAGLLQMLRSPVPPATGAPRLGHEEGRPNPFMLPASRTRVLAVSSGKGGVGKSSVTVNLAVALARRHRQVALLDADVYGFSLPGMLGIDHQPMVIDDLVIPPVANGVRCMSIGFFVEEDQPVIWRGPMLHKALEQFLADTYWGEPDYLIVDMPPGTGDVALSMAQYLPRSEILVVTTPQVAAQRVAQRSAFAARKLKLPVRGVIENMSWFTADDGTRYELFGSGGGQSLADDLGVALLGQVPLVPALRSGGDEGVPITVSEPDGEASLAFDALAERVESMGPARVYRAELTVR
jgi:ATP-binding protein involved in chromosome partitioning